MHLRRILAVFPVVGLLKLAACSDQDNPSFPKVPDDGDADASTNVQQRGLVSKKLCLVSQPGDEGKVIKATLLLPDAPVEGELFIDKDGTIGCAAESCSDAPGYETATKITCKDAVVSPGLINPHDHISFANNPPHKPTAERYEQRHDWRKGVRNHTAIPTGAKPVPNHVETAELRFAMSGVTAIAGAGGAAGLVRNVDGAPALLEAGLKMTIADSDTFPLADGKLTTFPTTCDGWPVDKRSTAAKIAPLKGYLPHISEGIDDSAHAEFLCQSNSFPGDPQPDFDLVKRQTAIVHGIAVNPADVARYRNQLAVLVWSPRSNIDLYGNTAPISLYDNLGVPIALGTDWLPSGSMNMARELRCADELNTKYFGKKLTDKQLWQAVTIHGAHAIGASHALGQLKKGYLGDVAIFDGTGKENPYRAVIEAGVEDTVLVLRGGKALYGDSELVKEEGSGGGAECEDINVCGVTKKACVKKDLGKLALSDLETAADTIYPLFFCKDAVPTNEPSCAPQRGPTAGMPEVSAYSGIKKGDKDGDGVADGDDNCATVFNPIRPMDQGVQADADGDGIGDACDPCPLEAGESCTPPVADDMDGDGVANADDNCPEDVNPDQVDADEDGKGLVCDRSGSGGSCDALANPGMALCPGLFTIAKLRKLTDPAHPMPGQTRASLKGVWVTAVKTVGSGAKGFFIQEGVGPYSGMFVADAAPTVQVGNRIDIDGDYIEKDGLSTLSNVAVTVVDPTTALPFQPVVIDPAVYGSAADNGALGEPLEAMLCVVNGPVSVTMQNADPAPGDFDELAVGASNFRVDDYVFDALDNTYAVGTSFPKIVGICGWSFKNRKIWPRTAEDITPATRGR